MRVKFFAAMIAAVVPLICDAATSIVIDAKANCLSSYAGATSSGASARLQLAPGRYVVSLLSNTMSCAPGGSCPINTVMLQGGVGSIRWGTAVDARPTVIDMTNSTMNVYAYVSDDVCSDNMGQATLLIQTVN